jgi:hypothetical protein
MLREDMGLVSNQKGLGLLELMFAGSMAFIVVAGISIPLISQIQSQKRMESYFWIGQVRSEIIAALKKKENLNAAILDSRNPSMNCLKPKASGEGKSRDCTSSGGSINYLKDSSGAALVNTISAYSGLDVNGKKCATFSSTSDDCPFRFEVTWTAICPSTGKCFNPDIKFEGKLLTSDKIKGPLNTELYGFRWILPTSEKSDVVCETSGIGQSSNGNCKLNIETNCPGGQFLVGFQSTGQPICKTLVSSTCPAGTMLQGFDPTGQIVCGGVCK